jgi:hypothetical protein
LPHAFFVSEEAVRTEVSKKPAPLHEAVLSDTSQAHTVVTTPLQKKASMLWCKFGKDSAVGVRLQELLEPELLGAIEGLSEEEAENMRFRFDAEVGEHTTEEQIAADLLLDIERTVQKTRFKSRFL